MLAKYYLNDTITDVPLLSGGVSNIPYSGSCLTNTGIWLYNGVSYDMREAGLYRFFDETDGTCFNKIACDDWVGGTDIYKLMSGISCNHLHGTDDNASSYQTVANGSRYRKIRAQCGPISGYCNWILPLCGFTTRVVSLTTLGALNGWDDGHIVIETQHGTEWRLWDITNGCYFTHGGVHLSAQGFVDQIANGGTFPTKVKLDGDNKFNSQSVYGIDLQIYGELFHANDAQNEAWYRRVFQKVV